MFRFWRIFLFELKHFQQQKFWLFYRNFFPILMFLKPSLGSEVPHKIWGQSVQPFWRILDKNKQTDRQTSKACSNIMIFCQAVLDTSRVILSPMPGVVRNLSVQVGDKVVAHLFTYSLIRWFIDSLIHWFIGLLVHWFIDSLVHWFIDSLVHWFIGSLVC